MPKTHNVHGNSKGTRLRARAGGGRLAVYPFAGIVGQEEMKLALLLNLIDPAIGGVLIMGHRGTGKSTAVRALADLLPQISRARDCFYGCDPVDEEGLCDDCFARLSANGKLMTERARVPVVELPLGATEDRVCGTINIERALREGVKRFEPGLLARANRGFLYIDEVNLLEDHLIDLLLDVSVTGRNIVERESVSVEHPARFVLVGSGNPEEGELRPQLLDRFGLQVEVRTSSDLDERVLIVERREAFEDDPEAFCAQMRGEQESLRRKLARARKNLTMVKLPRRLLRRVAELCHELKVDGHRGEIVIARAARALAALEGRREVSDADVRRVAPLALNHRLRRDPFEQRGGGSRVEQKLDQLFPPGAGDVESAEAARRAGQSSMPNDDDRGGKGRGPRDASANPKNKDERPAPPELDASLPEKLFDSLSDARQMKNAAPQSKRRSTHLQKSSDSRRGRYVRATGTKTPGARIALEATLRMTAGSGQWAVGSENLAPLLPTAHCPLPTDFRYKRFKRRAGTLFIFAVDTSGSMALNRIAQAKGALARLLQQSYVRRDRVALITFRGAGAELLLQPGTGVTRAGRLLDELSVGGATPLAAGLSSALGVAARARREGAARIALLIFTDGRANVPLRADGVLDDSSRRRLVEEELKMLGAAVRQAEVDAFVIDTQNRFTSNGEGQKLADLTGARYVRLGAGENL